MPSAHGPKVEKFYKSYAWKKFRSQMILYKKGICELCGKRGFLLHHKIPLDESNVDDPNIALNPDNMRLLCRDCHNKLHNEMESGLKDKPTWTTFRENGDVIIKDKPK